LLSWFELLYRLKTPVIVAQTPGMISEGELLRKISLRLIPFMFLLYIVSYLDRVNVSFAALQMNAALGFSAEVYSLGAGIFFIAYFVFEVPSNLILHHVGARLWIARIMMTWGIISSAMMFVKGPVSFYVLRFLLGAAEAGFFPGMILYLTYWFPSEARGRAIARFMTATAVAGAIGSPISGLLLQMNGMRGLRGWQWLFLLEGVPSIFLSFVTLIVLPDAPAKASWLTIDEKQWISHRLEAERAHDSGHSLHSIAGVIGSRRVWTSAGVYFGIVMSFYGITFWLPQIVKAFSGRSDFLVGCLSAIPWMAATICMVITSKHSDATHERRWHVALSAFAGAAGLVYAALTANPALELAALSLAAAGIWGTLGPFWAMSSESLAGAGAAAGIALVNSVGNLGGFLGPYLIGWVRTRTHSFTWGLVALAMFLTAAAVVTLLSRKRALRYQTSS
jgi:ACS family tartrate transporter-like MFS transporter